MNLMQRPTVSFIVPCYKLAHLLTECVQSILRQTYGDFEVLIMDDSSPDNTPEVAQSFGDPRVKHIRNEPNLGHLSNYNKGITLSQGKYIWLISADDYLRRPYVLQRYVECLERHPSVGYVFCPGYGVRDGEETRLLGRYSERRDRDRIFRGHVLLRRLLQSNFVLTPSGIVRRECYERVSLFDLNMPWCGDWYLWCLFAMYYDVAYFAEPMVCYREHHDLSMTSQLTTAVPDSCAAEEVAVPWMIRKRAHDAGYADLARQCLSGIARTYGRIIASRRYQKASCFMNFDHFEDSLRKHTTNEAEREYLRAQVSMSVGNEYYWQGELALAREFYALALRADPWMVTVRIKELLLALGKPGEYLRKSLLAFR
jgi:glycosyltransferase involved in cell wall biosynthesis